MLYGRRSGTAEVTASGTKDKTPIILSYNDGEVTWMFKDTEMFGEVEYYAEEAAIFDTRQGTYVSGYQLVMDMVTAEVDNPSPRVYGEVKDTDIRWEGHLSPHSLDRSGLMRGGEFI